MNDYKEDLLADLKNDEYSAAYLSAAIGDSAEAFLVALRDVAEARRGMAKLAADAAVNRENLYRMLSEEGNPRFSSLTSILVALGLRLKIEVAPHNSQGQSRRTFGRRTKQSTGVAADGVVSGWSNGTRQRKPSDTGTIRDYRVGLGSATNAIEIKISPVQKTVSPVAYNSTQRVQVHG